jgi:hypothetical protein
MFSTRRIFEKGSKESKVDLVVFFLLQRCIFVRKNLFTIICFLTFLQRYTPPTSQVFFLIINELTMPKFQPYEYPKTLVATTQN